MDLAPNSINSVEYLKGYSTNSCFVELVEIIHFAITVNRAPTVDLPIVFFSYFSILLWFSNKKIQ